MTGKDGNETPRLLSGGNPQIPKGDGEGPVQAYIAAMPSWKQDIGRWLDDLITAEVPDVRKAVRWNSPFYGIDDQGWFASIHCFTKYVKLTFFDGAGLDPEPPESGKDPNARCVHLSVGDDRDGTQMRNWIRQAAAAPGWDGF